MTIRIPETAVPNPIRSATVPVYGAQHEYPLIQDGSGVLVRLGKRHFLFTAAHNFVNWLADDGSLHAECKLFVSTTDTVFHKNEHRGPETVELISERLVILNQASMDVAVVELTDDTANRLTPVKAFLSAADMTVMPRPLPRDTHILFGHPLALKDDDALEDATPQTISPRACFLTHPLVDTISRPDDGRMVFKCPIDTELVSKADIETEPFRGFSGSGVWRYTCHNISPKLVGLFDRQCVKKRYIAATPLTQIFDALATALPDIAPHLSELTDIDQFHP